MERKAIEEAVALESVSVMVRSSKNTTSGERKGNVGGEQLHCTAGESLSCGMTEGEVLLLSYAATVFILFNPQGSDTLGRAQRFKPWEIRKLLSSERSAIPLGR